MLLTAFACVLYCVPKNFIPQKSSRQVDISKPREYFERVGLELIRKKKNSLHDRELGSFWTVLVLEINGIDISPIKE